MKGKESLQSFHIPRANNDIHGSQQELDDIEQHIQPLEEKERGERTWHGNTHSRGMEHSMQAEEQSGSGKRARTNGLFVGWPGRRGARGMRTCNSVTKVLDCVEPSATNERGLHTKRV